MLKRRTQKGRESGNSDSDLRANFDTPLALFRLQRRTHKHALKRRPNFTDGRVFRKTCFYAIKKVYLDHSLAVAIAIKLTPKSVETVCGIRHILSITIPKTTTAVMLRETKSKKGFPYGHVLSTIASNAIKEAQLGR